MGAPRSVRRRRLVAAMGAGSLWPPHAAPQPQPQQEQERGGGGVMTTSDGVRLSYLERSPPQGSPAATVLVLVPGWCMPAFVWEPQLAEFGARMRTIALDPRGQGDSAVPDGGYTADRRAADLHDLLEALPRVVLVGWSLGGLEALHYVYRYGAGRLAALMLVDNSVGEPPAPPPSKFLDQLRSNRGATLDRFVRAIFTRSLPEPAIERIEHAALRMRLQDSIALLSYPYPREHWRDIARAFEKPLAYCVTPQYFEQARNLERERPSTRIELFEHAGHALFLDDAPRFNRVLRELIDAAG
jgi:microsomal epoxide hydrolase